MKIVEQESLQYDWAFLVICPRKVLLDSELGWLPIFWESQKAKIIYGEGSAISENQGGKAQSLNSLDMQVKSLLL